jgi:hypothetical protein
MKNDGSKINNKGSLQSIPIPNKKSKIQYFTSYLGHFHVQNYI